MKFKVVGIGEVLWDVLPAGPQLGGAPANFACHARSLGAQAGVITRVGNDDFGREIIRRLGKMDIDPGAVQVDELAPTGRAVVALQAGGVPQFSIAENVAWDHLVVDVAARQRVQTAHAICFGSLAQRHPAAAETIQKLVAQSAPGVLKIFDVNLRQNFYTREIIEQSLKLAGVVKLNDQELAVLARLFELGDSPKSQVENLAQRFRLELVAVTLGGQGSLLHQSGQWSELPANRVIIRDTIGAGDAFTAALVMGLLHGMPLARIHRLATDVAGFVCSQPGATPVLPADLCRQFFSPPETGPAGATHLASRN
jgi:fructokinase